MIFPAKLREDFGNTVILSRGLDGCLFVYSQEEWVKLEGKIRELPLSKARSLQRFFFANAAEVEIDKQGRILIPPNLRAYANLTKDTVVIGASVRAEIWDAELWEQTCGELTPDMVADAMESLGF